MEKHKNQGYFHVSVDTRYIITVMMMMMMTISSTCTLVSSKCVLAALGVMR